MPRFVKCTAKQAFLCRIFVLPESSSPLGFGFHQEARVLTQALKVGRSPRYLRPLPARRRRQIRAEILADVAAVKKVRRPDDTVCIRP